MTATEHNKIIGILHIVEGGLQTVFGIFTLIILLLVFGFFSQVTPTEKGLELAKMKDVFIAAILIVFPILFISAFINLIAGWKILKEKSGARMWGIVASFISLINIPLGTAIGIYSLWFLFGVEGKEMYKSK